MTATESRIQKELKELQINPPSNCSTRTYR